MNIRDQLLKIMPFSKSRIDKFLPYLVEGFKEYNMPIDEARMFIAQLAVESGEFRYVKELASGVAYDTGKKAIQLGNTPEEDGDGQKYKGYRDWETGTGKSTCQTQRTSEPLKT